MTLDFLPLWTIFTLWHWHGIIMILTTKILYTIYGLLWLVCLHTNHFPTLDKFLNRLNWLSVVLSAVKRFFFFKAPFFFLNILPSVKCVMIYWDQLESVQNWVLKVHEVWVSGGSFFKLLFGAILPSEIWMRPAVKLGLSSMRDWPQRGLSAWSHKKPTKLEMIEWLGDVRKGSTMAPQCGAIQCFYAVYCRFGHPSVSYTDSTRRVNREAKRTNIDNVHGNVKDQIKATRRAASPWYFDTFDRESQELIRIHSTKNNSVWNKHLRERTENLPF